MGSTFSSMFSEENCSNPYFAIIGMADDNFVTEEQTLSNLKIILYRHLKEQGFDAVIFYDAANSIHCFDWKSRYILDNQAIPTDEQLRAFCSPDSHVSGEASAVSNTRSGIPRRQPQVASQNIRRNKLALNTKDIYIEEAYKMLFGVLSRTGYRCAVVFNDLHSIVLQQGQPIIEKRNLALRSVSENRVENKNIVIFVSSSDSHSSLETALAPRFQGNDWANFVVDSLLPKFTYQEGKGHVLRIGPPGAVEISNMLNMLRVRNGLNLDMGVLSNISRNLAAYCDKNECRLSELHNRINQWQASNPDKEFNLDEAATITGASKFLTAGERLDELVGMDTLKEFFNKKLIAYSKDNTDESNNDGANRLLIREFSGNIRGHGMNIALLGNPGTGKSTAAAIVGDYYREIGLLPHGKLVEINASQLRNAASVGTFVQNAIGGVLFIDEAYAITENRIYGQEIIDALVAYMGRYAGQMAFAFAGYERETMEFFDANRGLPSRVPNLILLPDYTGDQLLTIFMRMADKNVRLDMSELKKPESMRALRNMFNGMVGEKGKTWSNARQAETLLQELEECCADRTAYAGIKVPKLTDFPEALQSFFPDKEQNIQDALVKLEKITGMDNVKKAIINIARSKQLNDSNKEPGNYIFMGPPGTGKSMMAEKIGEIFQLLGVIKRRTPYVITAKELLKPPKPTSAGGFVDPRQNSLEDALLKSENGILFIDEAHQLAEGGQNSEGRALLRQLVSSMDQASFREKHCIILAGYITEMQNLLDIDPGLESRFPKRNRIKFMNYTYKELSKIMQDMAEKSGDILSKEFIARTELALSEYLSTPRSNFGNARFIRNEYLPEARAARDARIVAEQFGREALSTALTKEQSEQIKSKGDILKLLTKYDIPERPINFRALAGPVEAEIRKPVDPLELSDTLFEKDEVKTFISAINQSSGTENGYSSGINYIISGPVGCGKDTAITAIANMLAAKGLIDSNEVHHFSKGDLEAGYVGQTAPKTRAAVTRGQGGTVVLVQPSTLLLKNNSSDNSFGPEAIGEFVNCMGEFGENTSFVLLDSEEGMERFLKAYPACAGSFEHQFKLDDLSVVSMREIFRLKTADFVFDDEIKDVMDDFVANWTADRGGLGDKFLSWVNGDEIEKLVKKLEDNWAAQNGEIRIDKKRKYPMKLIVKDMFPKNLHRYFKKTSEKNDEVITALGKEIGLASVKEAIMAIEAITRRTPGDSRSPGNYCFLGNPGVGKTRMAQKLGNVLRAAGVLKQGHVIEKTAREMMQHYNDFEKYVRMARDNVLFIDEAHQLAEGSVAGNEVIKRLLTVLEDVEVTKNTCFILAGYPREMERLFYMDAGLASRFGTANSIIRFEDYSADELIEIMKLMAGKASEEPRFCTSRNFDLGSKANEPFIAEVRKVLEHEIAKKNPNYGNARFVRNLLQDSITAQLLRLDKAHKDEPIPEGEFEMFIPEDINKKYLQKKKDSKPSTWAVDASKILTGPASPILLENYSQAVVEISQSVLLLELLDESKNVVGHGTGFVISEDGYVLTCAHVIRDTDSVRARLYYPGMIGGEHWFEDCEILLPYFEDVDMGLIKINRVSDMKPLKLRVDNAPIDLAESIIVCGYPFGTQLQINDDPRFVPSVFNGSLSSIQQKGSDFERVFINCEAKSGNSGSPVISKKDGCVIGILDGSTTSKSGELIEEINFFTPIRMAWEKFIAK